MPGVHHGGFHHKSFNWSYIKAQTYTIDTPNYNWDNLVSDLSDKFIDYKNRQIILEETRNYYNLERLWEDGAKLDVAELLK